MNNFTQKFIRILALVFTMGFSLNAQEIGDVFEGGYIFQINLDGTGLVADLEDLGRINWFQAIDSAETVISQGYNDWYLPNIEELELMYNTIGQGADNLGNFENYFYWSSTEYEFQNNYALGLSFNVGPTGPADMNYAESVRVIRSVILEVIYGCTDDKAINFDLNSNTDDGSCIIEGCTDSLDYHFILDANLDNGMCSKQFPITFESDTLGHRLPGDFNSTISYVVSNPNLSIENNSSSVIQHGWYGPLPYSWQGTFIPVDPINFSINGSVFTMDVITSNINTPVLFKLEALDGSSIEQVQFTTTSNQWEQLTYDFSDMILDNVYSKVLLFFEFSPEQFGNEIGTSTFYFDNINQINVEVLLDLLESQISTLQADLDVAMTNQEDGVSLADVDAAYAEGAASVEVPECEEVSTQNIPLELLQGWNMIGYTCVESKDVVYAFSEISDKIEIVKDEMGLAYLPDWGFSAFDNLEYGKGYQVKMNEEVIDFQFCSTVVLASEDNEPHFQIGDSVHGGIVFYIDETGQHGLVAAMEDLEGTYEWGCLGENVIGADGQAIGTGYQNTLDIVSGCSETLIAASEALAYESEGYSDWYLPSRDELLVLENVSSEGGIGGFENSWYWSSSENYNNNAWGVYFGNGNTYNYGKVNPSRVRVIRAF